MTRSDRYFWKFHLIIRPYKDSPQYGWLFWRNRWSPGHWCLDVWVKNTLYTLTSRYA